MHSDTEIITLRDGSYCIEPIKDAGEGTKVLSYNFENGTFTFSPISGFIDKGYNTVFEFSLRNGTTFRCTPDHKLFVFRKRCREKIQMMRAEELARDLKKLKKHKSKWYRQILSARKIPSLGKKADKDLLWVEGQYVAEGWSAKTATFIGGDNPEIRSRIGKILFERGIPFAFSKRLKHGFITIHSSDFREDLRKMGKSAFEKHFIRERLSLQEEELDALLDGYAQGDAYLNPKVYPPSGKSHVDKIYGTISDELAKQLRLMHLILGRPLYSVYRKEHSGVGKTPLWELHENSRSYFNREIDKKSLSKIPIKEIEEIGKCQVCDITVHGTHNFVLADYPIVHNCEWLEEEWEVPTKPIKLAGKLGRVRRW